MELLKSPNVVENVSKMVGSTAYSPNFLIPISMLTKKISTTVVKTDKSLAARSAMANKQGLVLALILI